MSILDTYESSKLIGYDTARARYAELGDRHRGGHGAPLQDSPFPCIAGRATMSAVSRAREKPPAGGIMATGAYPGKARTPGELRSDLERRYSLVPGKHRLSLHASYLENGGRKVDRDQVAPGALRRLGRLGQDAGHRPGFQPDLFRPSQGRRQFHIGPLR